MSTIDGANTMEEITDSVTRIELPAVEGVSTALSTPTNVYIVDHSSPALINAGHPAQFDHLVRALRDYGITPADIERIIVTSWRVDVLGAASQFPGADLFVASPDMRAPRDLEMQIDLRRRHLLEMASQMGEFDDQFRHRRAQESVHNFYPRLTRDLRFLPLRNGHFVRAGDLRLEVLGTAGPGPGHMALYEADEKLLFCGDFAMTGLPGHLDDPQAYLVSLERLARLDSERVLPNEGRIFTQGRWTVSRAANFLNSFLSNAPQALVRNPTVLEFMERDRGHLPEDPVELLLNYELFRHLFDELVRSRTIAADGQGPERRYGVDIEDPRQKVRRK